MNMDWISYYYLFWAGLSLLTKSVAAIKRPTEKDAKPVTNVVDLATHPLNYLIGLPYIGRILGWW